MKNIAAFLLLTLSLFSCKESNKNIFKETYFGHDILDPYRNLEDFNDSLVIQWLKNQNKLTDSVINNLRGREELISKQEEYDRNRNYTIYDLDILDNNYAFYLKRDFNNEVSKLYYKTGIDNKEIEIYDPKTFMPNTIDTYQINYFRPNWNGSKVAISINKNEDEFSQIIVLDVKTKEKISHKLKNCFPTGLGGIHWLPDNNSFIFAEVPKAKDANENSFLDTKAVLYQTNKRSKEPIDIFSRINNPKISMNSEDFPLIEISNQNAKYGIGVVAGATPYFDAYYLPIKQIYQSNQDWHKLFKQNDKVKNYSVVGDSIFYISAKNASNFQICKTSIVEAKFDIPEILVKEKKDEIIKYFVKAENGDLFYSTVLNGVKAKLYRLVNGKEIEIDLPKPFADIKLHKKGNDIVISSKGWLNNIERYLFDFDTQYLKNYELFSDQKINKFEDLIVEEISVKSYDNVEVPLSLIYKKGTKLDGRNPVLMRAYGAYGRSMVPNAYYPFLMYAREGGIYAIPHVRGGGEKGNDWYKGGFKKNKPNSWKDFIACTEYLIKNKYTSKGKIAIWGGSAGGIVMGRAITERPDLFAAAIIDRGIFDMIRMEEGINGVNSAKEFGTVKDSIEFIGLLEMDSYQHIRNETYYPATLITTGINDSRVSPWHSFKFASRLQEANISNNPILLETKFEAGHGLQYSKKEEFEMIANTFAFALWQTGHPDYQPKE